MIPFADETYSTISAAVLVIGAVGSGIGWVLTRRRDDGEDRRADEELDLKQRQELREEIKRRKGEVDDLLKRNEALTERSDEQQQTIDRQHGELIQQRDEIGTLQGQVSGLESRTAALAEQIDHLQSRLT